jgi:hypothetical protein
MSKYVGLLLLLTLFVCGNNGNIKVYKMENEDIQIVVYFPKYITEGEQIRLLAIMQNKNRNAYMGGLTISFPQFQYTKGKYSGNTFDSIKSYSPPDKIYSSIYRKNIQCKYYMIEGWENKWRKSIEKKFYVELYIPKKLKELIIDIRGVLVFGKYKKHRTESILPEKSQYFDQQGYPVKRLVIPIYTEKKKYIKPAPAKKKEITTGTGFYVNTNGIITNNHVVDNCNKIIVLQKGNAYPATLKFKDKANDLAFVTINNKSDTYLKFRIGRGVRIGESIVAIGYPLGMLLGSNVKLTTGNISARTGLMNDTTKLQLTAPVQPGNSGGPLLDMYGDVVGVIYARLNDSSAQNVNLAIKSSIVKMFLDVHDIKYYEDLNRTEKKVVDIADEVKKGIVQIICE